MTTNTPFNFVERRHFIHIGHRTEAMRLFKKSIKMVEIEVFSFCNRRCWFCPNSSVDRISRNTFMDEELYLTILRQLAEIDYAGAISYSRYNEPLADKIILKRLRQAREVCPDVFLHTNTNGDYLTTYYLEGLYESGLRSLNIQVYSGNQQDGYDHNKMKVKMEKMIKKLRLNSQPVVEREGDWLESRLDYKDMNIRIYARNFAGNGCNRGGTVPIASEFVRTSPCLSPFYDLYIDFNGKVMPCCNLRSDIAEHKDAILADLNKTPDIFLIYTGKRSVSWRKHLIGYNRKEGFCRSCRFSLLEKSKISSLVN